MRKAIILVATSVLVAGMASPAAAATVIWPQVNVPWSATTVKRTVTVKYKGMTVATGVKKYKAKYPGKYRVTSTATYRVSTRVTVPADEIWAECRVTSRVITDDRTSYTYLWDGEGYYAGQVTVRYSGTCSDTSYTYGRLSWTASWSDDDYIMTDDFTYPTGDYRWTDVKLSELSYGVGDVDYVDGYDMSTLPTGTVSQTKTKKKTRTVYVR